MCIKKVVVITGAAQGLGFDMVKGFAKKEFGGVDVLINNGAISKFHKSVEEITVNAISPGWIEVDAYDKLTYANSDDFWE